MLCVALFGVVAEFYMESVMHAGGTTVANSSSGIAGIGGGGVDAAILIQAALSISFVASLLLESAWDISTTSFVTFICFFIELWGTYTKDVDER
jgi:hypothetical protein